MVYKTQDPQEVQGLVEKVRCGEVVLGATQEL